MCGKFVVEMGCLGLFPIQMEFMGANLCVLFRFVVFAMYARFLFLTCIEKKNVKSNRRIGLFLLQFIELYAMIEEKGESHDEDFEKLYG